jgi:predicted transport protein
MITLLIVVLVFSITITYIVVQKTENGTGTIKTKYYDIFFSNPIIDFDSKMEVKVNNEKKKISLNIPDLNEFKEPNSFLIDVKNIGNLDAYVDNMFLNNIKSNIETENINIDISLVKDEIIKGSESKRLIITIKYKEQEIEETPYLNIDINYKFGEVVL